MIKGIILGIALTIGLVGYGVIDSSTVEQGGVRLKNGINYVGSAIEQATR
mgnify:CR=1 FL=1|jgi:hypothetical protein